MNRYCTEEIISIQTPWGSYALDWYCGGGMFSFTTLLIFIGIAISIIFLMAMGKFPWLGFGYLLSFQVGAVIFTLVMKYGICVGDSCRLAHIFEIALNWYAPFICIFVFWGLVLLCIATYRSFMLKIDP